MTRDFGEEEPIPSSDPVSSSDQLVRQEPLAPTLSMNGELLSPGLIARGNEVASGELTEIAGSAVVKRGETLPALVFSQAPDQTTATLAPAAGGSLSLWGRWSS